MAMDPRPPLSSVEQVREELRRLGYLDHGVDRFVMSAAGSRSPLRAAFRAAWRVGLLGGPLFGIALTLGAAMLDARLRAEPRDLLVLGLYVVVLLSLLTAALAFAGGLVAAAARKRLGRAPGAQLSRNIGLAVAVAGLAYVSLWWRSHALGAPWPVRIGALLVGIALCVALSRFASLAAVAVLSAGGAGEHVPRASFTRRHLLPLVAGLALIFAGGVAAASYLGDRRSHHAPDFAVIPSGLRVRVLAIDGLEWDMTAQGRARGDMPRLSAALRAGAHARLSVEPEQVPAIVWTTVATGRGPEAHGIQSTGTRRLAGMRTPVALDQQGAFSNALGAAADLLRVGRAQPATSVLREAKAFWNVASEKGLRVGVVNWWATWPADALNGYVVTDRALFKLEKGGELDREVHPPALFTRLAPLATPRPAPDRPRQLDAFHLEAALLLSKEVATDLEAVYLSGLDITSMQQLGDAPGADLASLGARLDTVRAYHAYMDTLLGRYLDAAGPGDVTMIVGDPGRLARQGGRSPTGVFVMVGASVQPGDLVTASERDIAPTVLHLSGLPVSQELEGRVLEPALDAAFRTGHPVRRVASYGRRRSAPSAESTFDAATLEELRSLGYIR
jgi:hypothetical protein